MRALCTILGKGENYENPHHRPDSGPNGTLLNSYRLGSSRSILTKGGEMKAPKRYYPTYHHGCNPIHPVDDWCKVRRLIRAARRGDNIPPIITNKGHMVTGTHRSAANDIMMMLGDDGHLIPIMDMDDLPSEIRDQAEELFSNDDFCGLNDLLDKPINQGGILWETTQN